MVEPVETANPFSSLQTKNPPDPKSPSVRRKSLIAYAYFSEPMLCTRRSLGYPLQQCSFRWESTSGPVRINYEEPRILQEGKYLCDQVPFF